MRTLGTFPALLVGALFSLQGCTGELTEPNGGGAAASATGGTSGAGNGKGGSSGAGGRAATGGGPTSGVAAITRAARLTHEQYQNTVGDLLGITDRVVDAFAPDALNGFAFDTSVDYRVDARLGVQYRAAAETLAERAASDSAVFARIVTCAATAADCAGQFITSFGERAFRRPLLAAEVTRFTALFNQGPALVASGDAFRDGVRLVVEAMLQSPQFLYRAELSQTAGSDGFIALDDWEVASRLSYLAYNSMPDAQLFASARQGMLHTAAEVQAAATRLLADPRALGRAVSFHAQAWNFGKFASITPNRTTYPQAPADLVDHVYPAAARFVEEVVRGGGGLAELLTAPYAYADSALAPLYGKTVSGGLTRVDFTANERKGLLMQVGFLASNAYSIKTDPIHRGLFVVRNLLCREIGEPPAGASETPLPPTTEPIETTREEISLLTGQTACIGCHVSINAPGFAFEKFDAVGQTRTTENGVAVDTTGELEMETGILAFAGPNELVEGLAASEEARRCYAARWLEFSYGRELASTDETTRTELSRTPLGTTAIVAAIAASPAFLKRAVNEVGP